MNDMPDLIFWGTPELSAEILKDLHRSGFPIACVVTKEDRPVGRGLKMTPSPVKTAGLELGLNVLTPKNLKDPEFFAELQKYPVRFNVVSAYGKILPENLLKFPSKASLNVHYSLLPAWRGAAPIQSALLNGDPETGVSIIIMNEKMDEGDLLLSQTHPLSGTENVEELTNSLTRIARELTKKSLFEFDSLRPEPQNHESATYSQKLGPEDFRICPQDSAGKIFNQWRAFTPKPGLKAEFRELPIQIGKIAFAPEDFKEPLSPGELKVFQKKRLLVGTGDEPLEILEIKPHGKGMRKASDFINGMHLQPGECFR